MQFLLWHILNYSQKKQTILCGGLLFVLDLFSLVYSGQISSLRLGKGLLSDLNRRGMALAFKTDLPSST